MGVVVERQQGAVGLHGRDQCVEFGIAAVAPVDPVGPGERRDVRDPVIQGLQRARRRGRNGICVHQLASCRGRGGIRVRSEEQTSELQSLMRISYAVFCLKKKKKNTEEQKSLRKQTTDTTYV